ncbi:unnamed protein product [Caenorhabditis auriculariae]|uniref:Zinc finger protein-like 1 homolog n=1 Tax=Caenorhabditis auriculariae TaxID=2777116 RepID=A0A8S1H0C3_9PELO|nr:unnamed protein product [Caenorhabditis auriculariae]
MGLCKCPKKKVTNLFCFEHRVNVCEYCLVDNHSNCVVQSYLQWLTDSDYDPNCALCQHPLTDGETIRLQCLHVIHWKCFDDWASHFPATTAPAGYRCPCCEEAVFPDLNHVSPLIEKLREQLKQSNWARAALGLPVLPELNRAQNQPKHNPPSFQHRQIQQQDVQQTQSSIQQNNFETPTHQPPPPHNPSYRASTPATHLDIDDVGYSASNGDVTFARKKNYGGEMDQRPLLTSSGAPNDRDVDHKYKRRPPTEWLRGIWRAKYGTSVPSDRLSGCKKVVFLIFMVALILITVVTVLSRWGVGPSENDPLLDPMANPNIRVAVEETNF